MPKIERLLDRVLRERWATDKAEALDLIYSGGIEVESRINTNPNSGVKAVSSVRKTRSMPWASRGAYKLLTAFRAFDVKPTGLVCLDVGASTGGFTDVLLAYGANQVYAVDVGYGQLISRLACDSRVKVYDRCNARTLNRNSFDPKPAFVTGDASFISLKALLPALKDCAAPGSLFVLLIKPQFELAAHLIPAGGIVRDAGLQRQACNGVIDCATRLGLELKGLVPSDLSGTKGNLEFLACFTS